VAPKPSIVIIGAGALANSLAPALAAAGFDVCEIVARAGRESQRRAQAIARAADARVTTLENAALNSDVVWLCVSDDAIAPIARELARRRGWRGKVALHSSGAFSSALLAPLRRRGAAVASLHPMMTFVRGVRAPFKGLVLALEGDARAVRTAKVIAKALGARTLAIDSRGKTHYHVMGSFASPLIVSLLATAEDLGARAGLAHREAQALMRQIMGKTLDNYFRRGAAASFSGPLIRGDVGTVRAHLHALRDMPAARQTYVALLSAAMVRLPVRNREAIARALREPTRQPIPKTKSKHRHRN
jgi:predicted short-subunit dehydrogenase-like oxidoreductase (DUF2520 family)